MSLSGFIPQGQHPALDARLRSLSAKVVEHDRLLSVSAPVIFARNIRADGIADDSSALSDFLAECAETHARGLLPAGRIKVTRSIELRGASTFEVLGAGRATTILAAGAISGPVLDFNGVNSAKIGGFQVASQGGLDGLDSADQAIRLWWSGTGGATYHVKLHDVTVADCRCVTGVQLGANPAAANALQTSEIRLDNLNITGWPGPGGPQGDPAFNRHGLISGSGVSGNALNHWCKGMAIAGWAEGVRVDRCGVEITGASVSYNAVDFALYNAGFPVTVTHLHSEGSGRLLTSNSAVQSAASFRGVTWAIVPDAAHVDERIVYWEGAGTLSIEDMDLKCSGAAVGTYAPKVYFTGLNLSAKRWRVLFSGATAADLFDIPVGGTASVDAEAIYFINDAYAVYDSGLVGPTLLNSQGLALGIGPTADVSITREPAGVGGAALQLDGGGGVKVTGGTDQTLLVTKASGDAIRLGTDGTRLRLGSGANCAIRSDGTGAYLVVDGETYCQRPVHSDVAAGEIAFKVGNNGAKLVLGSGTVDYLVSNAGNNVASPGDFEITDSAKGLILKSPDGTRYRVTVQNGGTLSVAAI